MTFFRSLRGMTFFRFFDILTILWLFSTYYTMYFCLISSTYHDFFSTYLYVLYYDLFLIIFWHTILLLFSIQHFLYFRHIILWLSSTYYTIYFFHTTLSLSDIFDILYFDIFQILYIILCRFFSDFSTYYFQLHILACHSLVFQVNSLFDAVHFCRRYQNTLYVTWAILAPCLSNLPSLILSLSVLLLSHFLFKRKWTLLTAQALAAPLSVSI